MARDRGVSYRETLTGFKWIANEGMRLEREAGCTFLFGYEEARKAQAKAREEGRLVGIGVVTYTEICGLGPSEVAGAVGFGGGLWESAIVRFHPSGKVSLMIGSCSKTWAMTGCGIDWTLSITAVHVVKRSSKKARSRSIIS